MKLVLSTKWITLTGGVEMQVLQMSRELARRGHRIDLLFNRDGELDSEFREICHSVSKVPTFRFSRTRAVRDLIRLVPAVRAGVHLRPDMVYLNSPDELTFGLLTGLISRAPVICHLHNASPTAMLPRLAARAHRLIACSEFVRARYVEAGVDPSQVTVVHNGVDLEAYSPATEVQRSTARRELGLPEDVFVTLFLGRLDAGKGVEVLLEAWRKMAFSPDQARLLIVGSPTLSADPVSRLKELQGLTPQGCHWLPMRREVVTSLHAADVLAVPSTGPEPFGRVVVEGLASGLPVVASRVGGIPEILDGALAQFLVEPGSEVELADRLASLVEWRADRPDFAQQCRVHAEERFSIGHMVDGVEAIMHQAAS
jgi:glycosyltransferase involved in cell wall biosynthesis